MINITDKTKCCGCNACVQRCPKQCISMHEDEEGFFYPVIDSSVCIDCDVCEKVCPLQHPNEPKQPLQVLAARNKNEEQRLHSSSGGIFILLAEYTIRHGGVVFGARFDKNWEVEHGYAETLEELEPLMRSKYVQSRIGSAYHDTEHFLQQGRNVLFVGTSCQIAGLKKFLRKDYNNLLTVDFICHGVPSPGIWRRYLEEIQSERSEAAGKNTVLSSPLKSRPAIKGINFREKQLDGYGWKKFGFVVRTELPAKGNQNSVLLSDMFYSNAFMKGFLSNLYLRPSCYQCIAKNGAAGSDLTIADFWGIQNFHSDFDDDKGVSVVFLHSQQGKNILNLLSSHLDQIESTIAEATTSNPSYLRSVPVPAKRSLFWKTFATTQSVHTSINIATHRTISDKLKGKWRYYISYFIKMNRL